MDKKKVQEFINKLKETATVKVVPQKSKAIDNSDDEQSVIARTSAVDDSTETYATTNNPYTKMGYITVQGLLDGVPCEGTVVGGSNTVMVEIDLRGWAEENAVHFESINMVHMSVGGMNKMNHGYLSVYKYDTQELIGYFTSGQNIFEFEFEPIIDADGKTRVHLVGESGWIATQSFPASFMSVSCPGSLWHVFSGIKAVELPTKMSYLEGETFDPTGLVLAAVYRDGHQEILSLESDSADVEIPVITPNSGEILTEENDRVTISYKGKTLELPLTVEINNKWTPFEFTTTIEIRKRSSTADPWSRWEEASVIDGIYSNTIMAIGDNDSSIKQYRTIIKLNSESLDVFLANKKGIKLFLSKYAQYGYNLTQGHIIVNGKRQYVYGDSTFIFVDAGSIKSIIQNNYRIIFERDDSDFVFNATSNSSPTRSFYKLLDVGYKSETKVFDLTGGTQAKLDLVTGETSIIIPDISSESTLMGIGLAHIFQYNATENLGLGHRFRLNLHQTLKKVNEYAGNVQCYEYTDALGNRKSYYNYFYYYDEEGEKQYFVEENPHERIILNDENQLWDMENNRQVYYSRKKFGCEIYDDHVDTWLGEIDYFTEICTQTENKYLTPVLFQQTNRVIKGFNCAGNLVWISDHYGNFIAISYNAHDRITSVRDQNNNQLTFDYYNMKNPMLSSITDSRGRVIEYDYGDFLDRQPYRLYSINFRKLNTDGTAGAIYKKISLEYTKTDIIFDYIITSVSSSDGEKCVLDYNGKLNSITKYATIDKIPDGASLAQAEENIITTVNIQCAAQPYQTVITDEDGNKEIYRFSTDKTLSEYYQEVNGLVVKAERYEYEPYTNRKTIKATRNSLNKKSFNDYVFEEGETTTTLLDIYNNPTSTVISGIQVAPNATKSLSIDYEYDALQRCIKETKTETYSDETTFVYVTRNMYYQDTGILLKTIRYVQGEEATTGVTAEEYVYDEHGNISMTKRYNKQCSSNNPPESEYDFTSSSTTTIFYEEKEYNEQGQVVLEWDETGLYETIYEYVPGTNLLDGVTMPNFNVVNYAFDNEDRLIEISSSIDGRGNVSFTGFTAGEITDMNFSGNLDYLNYEYDKKRRVSSIKMGTDNYETITYEDKVSEADTIVDKVVLLNAKNETFKAVVDRAGNFEKAYYRMQPIADETLILEKEYDEYGQMTRLVDHLSGEEISIEYNTVGEVASYVSTSDNRTHTETFTYSARGQLSEIIYSGAISRTTTFSYKSNASGDLQELTTGNFVYNVTYDQYDRQATETIKDAEGNVIDSRSISYRQEGKHGTHMVNELTYADNSRLTYTYDECGNIQTVKQNDLLLAQYRYDGLNRLIREDNQAFGETYLYTYDGNGNILSRERHLFTTSDTVITGTGYIRTYTYNSKNQLINHNGQQNEYDLLGNPTSYQGNYLSWIRGRKLRAYNDIQFTYDAQGKRISKNTTKYYYNSAGKLIASSDGMEYFYGNAGVMGFVYNGQQYVYRKNLQGDIIAILDNTGAIVVQYVYDAWGVGLALDPNGNEITSLTHIGQLNPFRYRGYFYDVETGLYYLKSRYYDPTTGRFINMDSITYADPSVINGLNLYVYCENNPVMDIDPDGSWSWKRVFKAVAIVAVAAVVVAATVVTAGAASVVTTAVVGATVAASASVFEQAVIEDKSFSEVNWGKVGVEALAGAVTSVIPGSGIAASAGRALVGSLITNVGEYYVNGKDLSFFNIMQDTLGNLFFDFMGNKFGQGTSWIADKFFPYSNMNYSTLQNSLRKKGFDYSRAQVYKVLTNSIAKKNAFKFGTNLTKDFGFELIQELTD